MQLSSSEGLNFFQFFRKILFRLTKLEQLPNQSKQRLWLVAMAGVLWFLTVLEKLRIHSLLIWLLALLLDRFLFDFYLYLNYRSKLVLLVVLSVWPNTIVSWSLKMSLEMGLFTLDRIIESLENIEALINDNILIVLVFNCWQSLLFMPVNL